MIATPSASMPTNSSPMAVSSPMRLRGGDDEMPPTITAAPERSAEQQVATEEVGERDARQHPVRERVPDEGQAAHHDPRADERAGEHR
jgi:hypothetical protein